MKAKIYTIEVTKKELEKLIEGLYAEISEFNHSDKEEKAYLKLIDKLKLIKNN